MYNKKFWAHYLTVKEIIGDYIAIFCVFPFCFVGISLLLYPKELEMATQDEIKTMIINGLKWNALIMAIITVLFIVWFLYRSDRVECTDNAIKYYRWIFSKKSREIHYDEVTRCLLCGRIRLYKRRYLHGSVIRFFNKGDVILTTELYAKLGLALIYNLGDTKVEVIDDDNMKPRNIDRYFERYFKTGFMSLSYEDQLKLLHYYCKNSRIKTAEEILK